MPRGYTKITIYTPSQQRIFEEKLRQRIKVVSGDTALFFEQIFTKKTKLAGGINLCFVIYSVFNAGALFNRCNYCAHSYKIVLIRRF